MIDTERNERLDYRATPSSLPGVATPTSQDEQDFSTLAAVLKILDEGIATLHGFNAFDLTESEMKIKQQIKAHQLAADILEDMRQNIDTTLTQVNSKYRSK